jgi:hypothetical protein
VQAYSERTLQGNLVFLDVLNGSVRDSCLAVLDNRGNVNGLPSNGDLVMMVLVR